MKKEEGQTAAEQLVASTCVFDVVIGGRHQSHPEEQQKSEVEEEFEEVVPTGPGLSPEEQLFWCKLSQSEPELVLAEVFKLVTVARKIAWRTYVQRRTTAISATLRLIAGCITPRFSHRKKNNRVWTFFAVEEDQSVVEVLRLTLGASRTLEEMMMPPEMEVLRPDRVDLSRLASLRTLVPLGDAA